METPWNLTTFGFSASFAARRALRLLFDIFGERFRVRVTSLAINKKKRRRFEKGKLDKPNENRQESEK